MSQDTNNNLLHLANRVPEVTIYFWVIKVLATTIGETAADFLNFNLGWGLTPTSLLMAGLFLIALVFQLSAKRYVPAIYWTVVVLISVVGTLLTDNLVDNYEITLPTTTIAFALGLIAIFSAWYVSEKTLSIHSIRTTRRELFYWAAILITFALGTSAGDLIAENIGLGYFTSAAIFGVVIAAIYLAHRFLKLNAILAFWLAYILTRPFGATIADFLAQPLDQGGLGFGTIVTSILFLLAIAGFVIYLTSSGIDQSEDTAKA